MLLLLFLLLTSPESRVPSPGFFQNDVRNPLSCIRLGQAAGGLGHGQAPCGVAEQVAQHTLQVGRQGIVLLQQHRGAAFDQVVGVAGLVVVDRGGERHQHAADADRAQ
ncbi:hypothetical protein OZ12_14095, partial [Xanthomonas translucens pv. translucens]